MTQLFGPVSPHEDGAQARPGASSKEAALSSLPGGSCQCFAEMGSLDMRDGMEWRNGMASCLLPLASLWAGLTGETHVYRGRMDSGSSFPWESELFG